MRPEVSKEDIELNAFMRVSFNAVLNQQSESIFLKCGFGE